MAVLVPGEKHLPRVRRLPGSVVTLAVMLSLLVVGALQGGIAMVTNPTNPLGMTLDDLANAPIDDFFWPGMFLLGIAAAAAVTVAGLLLPWPWGWARPIESAVGFRWPWIGAVSIAGVLATFEILELFMVPFHPVMHPLLIGWSLAILLVAFLPSARRELSAEQ